MNSFIDYITNNAGTLIVAAAIFGYAASVAFRLIRKHKRAAREGGCAGCSNCSHCK